MLVGNHIVETVGTKHISVARQEIVGKLEEVEIGLTNACSDAVGNDVRVFLLATLIVQ